MITSGRAQAIDLEEAHRDFYVRTFLHLDVEVDLVCAKMYLPMPTQFMQHTAYMVYWNICLKVLNTINITIIYIYIDTHKYAEWFTKNSTKLYMTNI